MPFFSGEVQPVTSSNTPVEPLYSTVVKVKKKNGERLPPGQLPPADQATSKIKTKEPEILARRRGSPAGREAAPTSRG